MLRSTIPCSLSRRRRRNRIPIKTHKFIFGVEVEPNGARKIAPRLAFGFWFRISGSQMGLLFRGRGRDFLLDWRANQVSPFCPRSVVVAHVLDAHEVLEDEPGVRAALTDPAVGDDLAVAADAFCAVQLFERVDALERAVFV